MFKIIQTIFKDSFQHILSLYIDFSLKSNVYPENHPTVKYYKTIISLYMCTHPLRNYNSNKKAYKTGLKKSKQKNNL